MYPVPRTQKVIKKNDNKKRTIRQNAALLVVRALKPRVGQSISE